MDFDWSVIWSAMPELMKGTRLTLYIAILGLLGGLVLGFLAGLMRAYGNKLLSGIALVYIEAIRGTPIVVQVMFLYFVLPLLAGLRIDPIAASVLAIMVNSGAYIAEIVRGSFLSVPKGLSEAGQAVKEGDILLVIESMKLETAIRASRDGIIEIVHVALAQSFERDAPLITLTPLGEEA